MAHSDPCAGTGPEEPDPAGPNSASVYYATSSVGWSTVNLHYRPHSGAWTTVPGVGMEAACTGWVRRTVDVGSSTGLQAAFNNGNGVWDNNGGDYTLPAGLTQLTRTDTPSAAAFTAAGAVGPSVSASSAAQGSFAVAVTVRSFTVATRSGPSTPPGTSRPSPPPPPPCSWGRRR
ncbi:carbohydrate binding domain-containing protein [Streptomyces sp. CB00316]|uniref:carbohydrate binding domain-containing protein n=1 Tax=Streptomyces sp. CB00316 TaxID=1703932 RepID=UPI000938B8DA